MDYESMRRMDQEMNGVWVYEKKRSRDEWILSLWEGWIKRWMDYESMRRKDQRMNGVWVYEKTGEWVYENDGSKDDELKDECVTRWID